MTIVRMLPADRHQSVTEEIANSLSHGIALALAIALLPALRDSCPGNTLRGTTVAVFAVSTVLLFLSSALFHGLPSGSGKRFFDKVDHAVIYVFIAASYSPFAATSIDAGGTWAVFGLVWMLALLGVLSTWFDVVRNPLWSTGLYVAMGWLVLLAALPWIAQAPVSGVRLLLAGCVVYTLGAALFLLSARVRFAHFAWHLCVMAGSGMHFAAMLQRP